jgi:hypothetical protein
MDAGLKIRLFSGGLIPPAAKKRILEMDPDRISVIVNISAPEHCRSPKEYDATIASLKDLARFSAVGYTVFTVHSDPAWLVGLTLEANCRKHIRLGLAMPGPAEQKPLLPPAQYRAAAEWVLQLAGQCDRHDIRIGFDCGFAMCMFTAAELGRLIECACEPRFVCCPIIDIGPDLAVWSCFGASTRNRTRLEQFPTRQNAVEHYGRLQRPYRSFGVYDRCHTCKHKRRGSCAGGCLSHVMRTFHSTNPAAIAEGSAAAAPGLNADAPR